MDNVIEGQSLLNRQVNILEAKLKKAKEESKAGR